MSSVRPAVKLAARVVRVLRLARSPMTAHELAVCLGRRCTARWREQLGSLWLAGVIVQGDTGFIPGPAAAAADSAA